jgi:hypothetical protein
MKKEQKGEIDKTTKAYRAERMRNYRAGRRIQEERKVMREKMCQDRMNGDDIYTIGLRYGYNATYISRLFKDLPIKKHTNRHKLYWSMFGKKL